MVFSAPRRGILQGMKSVTFRMGCRPILRMHIGLVAVVAHVRYKDSEKERTKCQGSFNSEGA